MSGYDDRPEASLVPLLSEEVEALLLTDASAFASKPRLVRHLLTRMRATFAAHSELVRSLRRDIEQLAEAGKRRKNPVTAALDALAALTLEEQRMVFDRRAAALVEDVIQARREADAARVAAASETNRARLVLASVLREHQLDEASRARISAALEQLPIVRGPAAAATPVPEGGFAVAAVDAPSPDLSAQLFG